MNIDKILEKTAELQALLQDVTNETLELEARRKGLDTSHDALKELQRRYDLREQKVADREVAALAKEQQNRVEKQAIERQRQEVMEEKRSLQTLEEEKRQLEVKKKRVEGLMKEIEQFDEQKAAFEREKNQLKAEKAIFHEAQRMSAIREENIKKREARIDSIEKQTRI